MILTTSGLTKQFGELTALSNVDLEVQTGEIFGIVGPNGAGKSTLFQVISGYYTPTAGEIIFKGNSIDSLKPHQVCKQGLARTFQVATVFQSMTVYENLCIGSLFGAQESHKSQMETKVMKIIELLGLEDKKDTVAENLDLYTIKLVMFGAALATECELILLDEPMAGLSITEVGHFSKLLKKINKENSITIMIIEHLIDTIVDLTNRIMVLHLGQVIYTGPSKDMVNDEKVIEVYLGESEN